MNELHYQLDLLKAINQKLVEKERMYAKVCESAEGAFLYCSFEKNQITTLGQWKDFFDFEVNDSRDFSKFLDVVEEPYVLALRDILYLEKIKEESATLDCQLKGRRIWLQFRTQVSYDNIGNPTDKVIYINNITKTKSQNEELTYMTYYD